MRVSQMKKLLIIQWDGVSYPVLKQAIKSGVVPFVSELQTTGWKLTEIFSGIPSTTPASQCRLLYGVRDAIVGFRFLDKSQKFLFSPLRSTELSWLDKYLKIASVKPLLTGGAAIMSIFSGGAKHVYSLLTMQNNWPTKFRLLQLGLQPVRFTVLLLQILVVFLIERSEHQAHKKQHRDPNLRRQNVLMRILYEAINGQIAHGLVQEAINRGDPVIYANFGGYDHLAHHYGPDSRYSKYYLSILDLYLRRLSTHPKVQREYEVVVLSDHGQTQSVEFAKLHGASLATTLQKLYPDKVIHDETKDTDFKPANMADLYLLASGGLALAYAPILPQGPALRKLEKIFPALLDNLCGLQGVGAVIYRTNSQTDMAYKVRVKEKTVNLEDLTRISFLHDIPDRYRSQIISELNQIMSSPFRPDLLILGEIMSGTQAVNFEAFYGGHGGVGGWQTRAFVLHKNIPGVDEKLPNLASLHPILLKMATPNAGTPLVHNGH